VLIFAGDREGVVRALRALPLIRAQLIEPETIGLEAFPRLAP
jgi:hypothetical protein